MVRRVHDWGNESCSRRHINFRSSKGARCTTNYTTGQGSWESNSWHQTGTKIYVYPMQLINKNYITHVKAITIICCIKEYYHCCRYSNQANILYSRTVFISTTLCVIITLMIIHLCIINIMNSWKLTYILTSVRIRLIDSAIAILPCLSKHTYSTYVYIYTTGLCIHPSLMLQIMITNTTE